MKWLLRLHRGLIGTTLTKLRALCAKPSGVKCSNSACIQPNGLAALRSACSAHHFLPVPMRTALGDSQAVLAVVKAFWL